MQLSRLKLRPNLAGFKRKQKKIKFSVDAPEAKEIFLVGDFNTWEQQNLPMKKNKNGEWDTTLKLCSGRYEYKDIIDGEWKIDPKNENQVATELGTINSVITVTT